MSDLSRLTHGMNLMLYFVPYMLPLVYLINPLKHKVIYYNKQWSTLENVLHHYTNSIYWQDSRHGWIYYIDMLLQRRRSCDALTPLCISVIIGLDNGLSPVRPQAIIQTNDEFSSTTPLRTDFIGKLTNFIDGI